jgi:hypothetical protein
MYTKSNRAVAFDQELELKIKSSIYENIPHKFWFCYLLYFYFIKQTIFEILLIGRHL